MDIDTAVDQFFAFLSQVPLLRTLATALLSIATVFLVILFFEWLAGGNLRRYFERAFATDVCYALIYQGGI
jgi:hypothetical protein